MPFYALGDLHPVCDPDTWTAPNATVIGQVTLQRNASIWWGSVVRGDTESIELGEASNIQDNCVIHADPGFPLVLEREVTVGHMAMLHGCKIGQGSLIGIKSVIMNGAVIGKECLIGANTLIPEGRQIPDRSLVVGSPGRILRTLTDEEVARLYATAQHYVDNWKLYLNRLTPL